MKKRISTIIISLLISILPVDLMCLSIGDSFSCKQLKYTMSIETLGVFGGHVYVYDKVSGRTSIGELKEQGDVLTIKFLNEERWKMKVLKNGDIKLLKVSEDGEILNTEKNNIIFKKIRF